MARSRRGSIGETWWSTRFVDVLESFAIGSRLQRGRTYARRGRVLDLTVEPGLVRARVQGSRRIPYDVRIRVKTLSPATWTRLEEALAAQALFAARLLAGEMPHEIEEAFATLNLSLFPERAAELETDCSCPDFANPCKHIAAIFYILAEAFDEDPFLIFAWRGRTREQVMSNLRRLRGMATAAVQAADQADDAEPNADIPPLVASIDAFWKIDSRFDGLHVAPHASDTPDALLRQLGSPPPEAGGQELLERLASVYHAMAAGAERLAYLAPDTGLDDHTPDADSAALDGFQAAAPQPAEAPSTRRQQAGTGREPESAARPPRRQRAGFLVTDLRDFENAEEPPSNAAARRLSEFLGSIVRTATSISPGLEARTPLRCRRTRGRSPCPGRLVVRLSETPAEIHWACVACGEAGLIHGWVCSSHDLGGPHLHAGDAHIEASFSNEQYDLLAGLDCVDITAEQLILAAHYEPDAILISGTPEQFAALRAEISVAIESTRQPTRRARLRDLLTAMP